MDPKGVDSPTVIAFPINVIGMANSSCFLFLSSPVSTTSAMVRSSSQNASPPSGSGRSYGSEPATMGAMARDLWVLCEVGRIWVGRRTGSATTHLRSSKEYVLTGMSVKSPAGLGRGEPGLGRTSMSWGERILGEAVRVNSAGMVVSGTEGAKGCWTERPRRCRAASANHIDKIWIWVIRLDPGPGPGLATLTGTIQIAT